MEEQILVSTDTDILTFNNTNKSWVPIGNKCNISIVNDPSTNSPKIIVKSNNNVVVNNPINSKLKYNEAMSNFHQWRDNTGIYGIKFPSDNLASEFAAKLKDAINLSNTPPVVQAKAASQPPIPNPTPQAPSMSTRAAPPPPPPPMRVAAPPPPSQSNSAPPPCVAPPPCAVPPPCVAPPPMAQTNAADGDLSSALLSVKLKKSQPPPELSLPKLSVGGGLTATQGNAAATSPSSSGGGGGDIFSEMAQKLANRKKNSETQMSALNAAEPSNPSSPNAPSQPSIQKPAVASIPATQNSYKTTKKIEPPNPSQSITPNNQYTTNASSSLEWKKDLIANVNQQIDAFRTQLIDMINRYPN